VDRDKDAQHAESLGEAHLPPAKQRRKPSRARKSAFDGIAKLVAKVPKNEWKKVPADLSLNADHYLYGSPRR